MNKIQKIVLICMFSVVVLGLTACAKKGVEPQELYDNSTATSMAEENYSIEGEENIIGVADVNDINWNEILNVPADEAANESNPENRMAHNVYMDPDLSATSGKFDGFSIDFKADETGMATYWALCNWQMNKEDLMSKYDVIDDYAGAYAGLQMRRTVRRLSCRFGKLST